MADRPQAAQQGPHRSQGRLGTPDARVQRSRAQVLGAALDLLMERGVGGVSVEDVSRRSGVAKTTIYRHWPTRADLILGACAQLATHQAVPETGSFRGDLVAALSLVAELLKTARWASVMPSIIDAAERDPALAAVHSRIQQGHAAPLRTLIARAAGAGELPSDIDAEDLTAALLGPLYYRRWFSREPLDDAFVQRLVERIAGQA